MATSIAAIALYFVKGLVFTSVYYGVLLMLAVLGLLEWKRRATIAEQSLQPPVTDEKDRYHRT